MARLLQIFGFLSVLFRGATLTFQSLVVGGVVFLIFVLRRANVEADALKPACLRWIRCAAFALAAMQIAYVLANSLILMQSAGISLTEVSGASFVLAGALGILSAFTILALAGPRHSNGYADLLLPAAAIIASSVITSHAMARLEYRLPLVAFTALHQGATAAWLGGLPYLLIAIRRTSNPDFARQLSARFSQLAQQSELRKPGAQLAREVRIRCPPYGDEQIRQAAEPRCGSPLMQGGESNQRQAIFQASHRVAGDDRGSDDGGCGKKQIGVAIRMPRTGKGEDRERRQDAERASQDKACAAHLSEADASGLHQDEGVRHNVSDLHRREHKGRAPNPTQTRRFQRIRFNVGAAQHEIQKNNSADDERLKC